MREWQTFLVISTLYLGKLELSYKYNNTVLSGHSKRPKNDMQDLLSLNAG